jgi:hypothetical protein
VVGDARFQGGMPEGAVALAGLPGALGRISGPETREARAAFERIRELSAEGSVQRRLGARHQRRAGERHHRGSGASAWALAGCACAVLGVIVI